MLTSLFAQNYLTTGLLSGFILTIIFAIYEYFYKEENIPDDVSEMSEESEEAELSGITKKIIKYCVVFLIVTFVNCSIIYLAYKVMPHKGTSKELSNPKELIGGSENILENALNQIVEPNILGEYN